MVRGNADQNPQVALIENEKSVNKLLFSVATALEVSTNVKLRILQQDTHQERLTSIQTVMKEKNDELKVTREVEDKVRKDMQEQTKRVILRKQLDHINKELYGGNVDDMQDMEERIAKGDLPPHVKQTAEEEFRKLKSMGSRNPETDIVRSYLKLILDLPWTKVVEETLSLERAQTILDRDHCGLTKVKQRILQFLAVRQLTNKGNQELNKEKQASEQNLRGVGSIICFYGPPGVGKTSLGQSIAEALNRPFFRISLGGVRDEAQIRGHRRTYVAALPGQLISAMKKVKCKNPVILLDEIDKIGKDNRGDPSSALLEVLDPEQNQRFMDHYLGLEFDLSQVFFIATANNLQTIQAPLLDRLEIIQIPGYSREEKVNIAISHLIPKQLTRNGLTDQILQLEQEDQIVQKIVTEYTSEAGVRQLERNISALFRDIALKYVKERDKNQLQKLKLNVDMLNEILGPAPYAHDTQNPPIIVSGVARGLAWTSVGGKTLLVEAVKMPGKGRFEITGQLGDIMKESVRTALGFIKSNWDKIEKYIQDQNQVIQSKDYFDQIDLHVHFPAGAIPKDGPSAGITIATALVSLFVNKKVRNDIAMTGEISLTGQVLPVGGIKEKVLAAYEAGIRIVILPHSNQQDIQELEKKVHNEMNFFFVRTIQEVLEIALGGSDLIISNKSLLGNSKL